MTNRRHFIAANWKMNKTASETEEFLNALKDELKKYEERLDLAICPPFTSLEKASKILSGTNIKLGAQDMSTEESGAFTGEVSADMLLDLGVEFVIVGHSERRQYHEETNDLVNRKAKAALDKGLKPIVCIGESLEQRENDKTEQVITEQIKGSLAKLSNKEILQTTIAYEPVWAIGTGRTATPEQAQEVHALIRDLLKDMFGQETAEKIIIQYGGSVKPSNSADLISCKDIDGALVGGASLKEKDFPELIKNAL